MVVSNHQIDGWDPGEGAGRSAGRAEEDCNPIGKTMLVGWIDQFHYGKMHNINPKKGQCSSLHL